MSDILSQFKALKLHGMAECYAELQAKAKERIQSRESSLRVSLTSETAAVDSQE
jgi:hypothetical protein